MTSPLHSAFSVAPYAAPIAPRVALNPKQPWLEAGRSHLAAADRYALGAPRLRLLRRADRTAERFLRDRAAVARTTARTLEPLRTQGWVVLHDRTITGTSAVIDHVLIGPPGLVIIQNRPATRLWRDFYGHAWADGLPLTPEREQVRWAMREVLRQTTDRMAGGWQLYAYPFLMLHAAGRWPADLSEPACLLAPTDLLWALGTYPPALAPLHITDLALSVEDVCPFAPLEHR